ncbi:hypothetical protein MTO96_002027 [Rhipicephalus appendiculatus]
MNDGCRLGLNLVLDVELSEYLPLSVEAGFAILVHYPWREIDVAKDVTFVAPGFSTYITLDRAEFRRLGHPYQNPCRSQWPPEISEYVDSAKHYTAHECRDYCYQVQIFEACGCVSPQYMRPGRGPINDAPICPVEDTAGPVTCAQATEMKIGRGGISCECSQPCLSPPCSAVPGGLMGMYLGVTILLLLNLADALAMAIVQWISTKDWRQRCKHFRHEFLSRLSREKKPPLSLIS